MPKGVKAGAKFPYKSPDGSTVYLMCPKPFPSGGKFKWHYVPRGTRPDQRSMQQMIPAQPQVAVKPVLAPPALMAVTVPHGAAGGHTVQVQGPGGAMHVQVPMGLGPGAVFQIQLPPAPPVLMTGQASSSVAMGVPLGVPH